MKRMILIALVVSLVRANATLFTYNYTSGFNNGGVIPDGNITGWSDTRVISNIPVVDQNLNDTILDVNVRLNITGGFNGDLYAYLVHSSGFAVLLNRPGRTAGNLFGYGDSGMNVTFNDQASQSTDIHLYQTVSGYNSSLITGGAQWQPDGRTASPSIVFDTDSRTALLGNFNNVAANGSWTLFLADFAVGDVSTVTSWGLELTVVPEPVTCAGMIFTASFVVARFCGRRRSIRQVSRVSRNNQP